MACSVTMAILVASCAVQAVAAAGAPNPAGNCYYDEEQPLEKGGAKGRNYRGVLSSTISGRECQKWNSGFPWKESLDFNFVPDEEDQEFEKGEHGYITWGNGLGNHNYCRNPDQSEARPWCFTSEGSKEHKKEECDIPECEEQRDVSSEAEELKLKMNTPDCQCAQQLYGGGSFLQGSVVRMGKDKQGRPCRC